MAKESSLYEQIGGEQAITAAVSIFYDKVLADPVTRPFFDSLDMEAQSRKLIGFMAWAFGGPRQWKGRDLRQAHRKLVKERGLNDQHFDAVAAHLRSTLEELNVAPGLINQALGIVASTRKEVLSR